MEASRQPPIYISFLLFLVFFSLGFIVWHLSPILTLLFLAAFFSGAFICIFPTKKSARFNLLYIAIPLLGFLFSSTYSIFGDMGDKSGPSLEDLAESGDADAQYAMGLFSLVTKDDKTVEYLLASAQQGNAKAQYMIGMLLQNIEHEHAKSHAYKWLLLSKKGGNEDADESINHLLNILSPEEKTLGEGLALQWEPLTRNLPNKSFQQMQSLTRLPS